jgi:uncharacterized membrane protein
MEYWLNEFSHHVALLIEAVAIVIVAIGSAEAFINIFRVMLTHAGVTAKRDIWLRYARWLVAGLTFQLAGDIVHTAIAPTWDEVGRLAAIAVIRTFLTYFLDRDIEKTRELRRVEAEAA